MNGVRTFLDDYTALLLLLVGFLARWCYELVRDLVYEYLDRRSIRQAAEDTAEINRIEAGLPLIAPSPVPPRRAPEMLDEVSATGWEPARFEVPEEPQRVEEPAKVGFWRRMQDGSKPRTPRQIADEAFAPIQEELGIYHGRHRASDHTQEELVVILTPTSELPMLRMLRPSWSRVPVPLTREVFA